MRIDLVLDYSSDVLGARGIEAFIDNQPILGLRRVEVSDDAKAEGYWENSENCIHFVIPNIEVEKVVFDNGALFIGEVDYED